MALVNPPNSLAEVVEQLGNIDLARIRMHPAPGIATAADVESIHAHEKRLFELVDGILVEKVMGFRESLIAIFIALVLGDFVAPRNLGLVVGADGMMHLLPQTVRIPDVAFVAWNRIPEGRVPQEAVPALAPTLAVEVLSASNTAGEMSRKRREYLASGVELIWEVNIDRRSVTTYTSVESSRVLSERDLLTADSILPGFEVAVADIFAELDRQPG